MGSWSRASRSHVAHMSKGDFYGSEKSAVIDKPCTVRIEHVSTDGSVSVLKEKLDLIEGEVIDASFLSVKELREFLEFEMQEGYT